MTGSNTPKTLLIKAGLGFFALLSLLILNEAHAKDDDMKERVADLRYGTALYYYFQGQDRKSVV